MVMCDMFYCTSYLVCSNHPQTMEHHKIKDSEMITYSSYLI